ncbi:MAG: hypothetical protein AAB705_01670 [Patescibacteria group bacterium]
MAGINGLNRLRNINLSSVKETAKRTAAVTLLLSMTALTACSASNNFERIGDGIQYLIWDILCIPSLCGMAVMLGFAGLLHLGDISKERERSKNPRSGDGLGPNH